MRTTIFSSVPYKFLAALAIIAMALGAIPAQPAFAATITVTNTTDDLTSGNGCSLREAIINANNNGSTYPDCAAGSGAAVDVITLASGSTHILSLTGASANTTGDLDISDPAGLTIQASAATPATIDGGDIDRVLDIAGAAGNLTLNKIIVTNGTATSPTTGGGISFGSTATLTLTNSTISGNNCSGVGADGGGLFINGATLTITNSTFSGNITNDNGGAINIAAGTATITNSTFASNTSSNRGGAIQVGGGTATIDFSTFSGNAANAAGNNGGGALQVSAGSVTVTRSILANSTAGSDCNQSLTGTASLSNSILEVNTTCTGTFLTSDPGLGALADNGGPTQTMAITQSSPAYNTASSCGSVTTDQRGVTRPLPVGGACDLGAYEFQDTTAPTVVSIVRASGNPTSAASVNYTVTFSEPVVSSGVGASDFSLTLTGSLTNAAVSGVSGSGAVYTVSVNTGTGNGTLRLDMPVTASVVDSFGNGLANLPCTSGEVYDKFQVAPGTATLVSPNGTIYTNKPTYTWNEVFDTTWYYLWVSKVNGDGTLTTVHNKWYDANLVCSGGTCSVTPDVTLTAGNYRWWIRTWNPAGYGQWSLEKNFTPSTPGAATLGAPNGSIGTNYNPTYTWNKVTGATWYYLWVNAPSGNGYIKQWFDASLVCDASTCSATPAKTLAGGAHTWFIQTWNSTGLGPWSAGMPFSTTPLGAAALVSPTGSISDYTPTYTWNEVAGATYYYLYVNGPSGNVIKAWYQASTSCSGGTCSAIPETALGGGAHTWWVRTWNSAGYGAWSDSMGFSLPIPKKPLATTLISPAGSITNTTPTYSWNAVLDSAEGDAATWYYLWVKDPTGNVIKQWYDASVICSGATCSVTPSIAVTPGSTTWWVQTYNAAGYGPWSSGLTFSIPVPWPVKPTLISPISTTNDFTPTYIWNAVSSETGVPASYYQLSLNGVLTQWYPASSVCSGGTCAVTPSTILIPGGTYTWQVRGWNSAGNGVWSNLASFTHVSAGGFNSQFNGSAPGWTPYTGSWSILNNSWYGAYGSNYYWVTSAYTAEWYGSFDVQSVVKTDTPDYAYMIVRGSPAPFDEYGDWYSGYYFGFDGYGYYQVGKMVNGYWTDLQPWTYTPALNPGNWNTLRVIASGNNLYYYINGTLVWSGVDPSLTYGAVGFELGTYPSYSLWVDSVTLNSYYARSIDMPIIADTISPG